ncbi:NAC domain-containing protein [Melia azedarach]|uniref:NAC domain-containing protein n=2 Tax=Melia azedarach TaxID=155640 RepID=A0ACC1XCS2_MELAZ|nr:NAC domain-containing protein [Melia azedarach]KAJ4709079.1 NAC domain-containing protein [Melia azedarach]
MAPSDRCRGIYLSNSAVSELTDESKKWAERKPIGIRFNPTDEVLAGVFLVGKVFGSTADSPVFQFFKDAKVYDYEPENLKVHAHEFGEGKMYFFTTLNRKPSKGRTIIERTVGGSGCWKKTGKPLSINVMYNDENLRVEKTSLVFCKKIGAEEKNTKWLMKEYMLDLKIYERLGMSKPLVLCVVYWNEDGKKNQGCENLNGSSDDASEQISKSNMVEGASPTSHITASSSPPPIQNYPNPYHQPVHCAPGNLRKRQCREFPPLHENPDTFHTSYQLGSSSNLGITPEQIPILPEPIAAPNPCCQTNLGMHSASDNPTKRHCLWFHTPPEISDSFSINHQQYPGPNLELSEPTAAHQRSLPEPAVSETPFPKQNAVQSQDSLFDNLLIDPPQFINQEPQPISAANTTLLDQHPIMDPNFFSPVTHCLGFHTPPEISNSFSINYQHYPSPNLGLPEPTAAHQGSLPGPTAAYRGSLPEPAVSETSFFIQDAGQSQDSLFDNLPSDRPQFMNQEPQSISAANTNLLDQHLIMDPDEPSLFREQWFDESWYQKIVNEHGSNQQQLPQSSLDLIHQITQMPGNYEMTRNPSEQQPAGMPESSLDLIHQFGLVEGISCYR